MKAIIKEQLQNGRNYGGDKEMVSTFDVIASDNGELKSVVTARCHMGRSRNASTVYAAIWVHGKGIYTAGHGSAGGYGYHKESAAIDQAIRNAGIELYGDVYDGSYRWHHTENRENTPKEIAAIKRRMAKKRAHIGGVGESAIEAALLAIARAAGFRGKLIVVKN